MQEWKAMLQKAENWAREAGRELVKRAEGPMDISSKTTAIDLVTEMDIWTESFLTEKIKEHYPGHKMKTEESGSYHGDSSYEWVIDPIDGTVNYARGIPFYGISIGIRYEGETAAGLVYAPKLDEMFTVLKGSGAWLNGNSIHSSEIEQLEKAVIGTGFPYDKGTTDDNNLSHVNRVVPRVGGLRRTGSAALDLCQVACGRMDACWEIKLNDWDVEAGLLMVKEAGGKTKVKTEQQGLFVLASTPGIYDELNSLINRD
ncbi:inositol monophosphatase family protein [Salibacterium aidingense]|uniref:inositol monophosphatase family protein n=1 Tax=Salibacterium aidingense TaxID=384933 RepID=UPI003BBD4C1F